MSFISFQQNILNAAQSGNSKKFFQNVIDSQSFGRLMEVINKNGDNVIHLSARSGCVEIIQYCYQHNYKSLLTQRNNDGKMPLHVAAQYGQLQCLEYLLSCSVPVDALKRSDWTPLMLACTRSDLNIVKSLISHGANPNCQNKDGWTALHIAARENNLDIIKYLLSVNSLLWKTQSKNGRTPLHTSALHGSVEVVQLFLNYTDHEIECPDSCGITPLMDAISGSHNEIVKILLKFGASLKRTDSLGRNLLHLSAETGNIPIINYLVQTSNIDINSQSNHGLTALHYAVKGKNLCSVKRLLELGINYALPDFKGRTAFDYTDDEKICSVLKNVINEKIAG